MTEQEFIQELRDMIGPYAQNMSRKELFSYISYNYNAYKEISAAMTNANPNKQTRGLEDLFASFGTPETVLAAFLLQLFARYSKDMVDELLHFFKEQQEQDDEQKEVSG